MSNTRFDLPDGQWADIRDPKTVTRGGRKPVRSAMLVMHRHQQELQEWAVAVAEQEKSAANPGIAGPVPTFEAEAIETGDMETPTYSPNEAEVEMIDAMQESLVVALVTDWSYDLPVTRDSLNELPADEADALVEHCSTFIDQIFVSTEPSPDDESPTQP